MIGNVCFLLLGIPTFRNLLIGDNCLIERKHKKLCGEVCMKENQGSGQQLLA